MTTLHHTIGVVDDDASVRGALNRMFRLAGFKVALFATAEEFLSNPRRAEIDCLAIDVRLPGMDGLELLNRIRGEAAKPAFMISAHEDDEVRARAFAAGARGFFLKPFDNRALLAAVINAPGIDVNYSNESSTHLTTKKS